MQVRRRHGGMRRQGDQGQGEPGLADQVGAGTRGRYIIQKSNGITVAAMDETQSVHVLFTDNLSGCSFQVFRTGDAQKKIYAAHVYKGKNQDLAGTCVSEAKSLGWDELYSWSSSKAIPVKGATRRSQSRSWEATGSAARRSW